MPSGVAAMPPGLLKRAAVPAPLALPELPERPAALVTTAALVILRMLWLPLSATWKVPEASRVMAFGVLKRALPPVASVVPEVPARPAKVVTSPAGVILRMAWLPLSAT